jgi:hypothetical protein
MLSVRASYLIRIYEYSDLGCHSAEYEAQTVTTYYRFILSVLRLLLNLTFSIVD